MTREEKINALALKFGTYEKCGGIVNQALVNHAKECILAGIALRDAELDLKRLTSKLETYLKIYTGDKELERMLKAIKEQGE